MARRGKTRAARWSLAGAFLCAVLAALAFAPDAVAQTRLHPLSRAVLAPWYGTGCPDNGRCACAPGARTMADEFNCQMDALAKLDIPIGVYLFDGNAWSRANSFANNQCVGEACCSWALGDAVVDRLKKSGVRALLHFWGGCHEAAQYQRAYERLGPTLLGFYLDDGSSDIEARRAIDFMATVLPGDSEVVLKAIQGRTTPTTTAGLRAFGNVAYVGDCHYDFEGLRNGVHRLFSKAAFVPAPFNELSGYWYEREGVPSEDVYMRRLHFGALQPIMANTPYANMDPWGHGFSLALLNAYRTYAWLHKELVPYIESYALAMHENPAQPVLSPLSPDGTSALLGHELFAVFVTEPRQTMRIDLPPGDWIDFWNEDSVSSGSLAAHPVPLGREPLFVRDGAIIPLDVERAYAGHGDRESSGSLTVLVYPRGTSTFRYRASGDARDPWTTFTSEASGDGLRFTVAPPVRARPLLVRVGRWATCPRRVGADARGLYVNTRAGATLARAASEKDVNGGTTGRWFYDAAAKRLIVKLMPALAR